MGVNLFPDVDFPIVTVSVVYEGADPEAVESEVTDMREVKDSGGHPELRPFIQTTARIGKSFPFRPTYAHPITANNNSPTAKYRPKCDGSQ